MVKIVTTKLSQWVRHITRSPGLVFLTQLITMENVSISSLPYYSEKQGKVESMFLTTSVRNTCYLHTFTLLCRIFHSLLFLFHGIDKIDSITFCSVQCSVFREDIISTKAMQRRSQKSQSNVSLSIWYIDSSINIEEKAYAYFITDLDLF